MGTLKYKRGDLLAPSNTEEIIAHGCNASNSFGSGVAGAIKFRYPEVKKAYHNKNNKYGLKLGDVQFVEVAGGKIIVNMITQQRYGYDKQRYVDYDAIKKSMGQVLAYAEAIGCSVAIPKIGAGLGGGDWSIIEGIIVELLTTYNVGVTVYEL